MVPEGSTGVRVTFDIIVPDGWVDERTLDEGNSVIDRVASYVESALNDSWIMEGATIRHVSHWENDLA